MAYSRFGLSNRQQALSINSYWGRLLERQKRLRQRFRRFQRTTACAASEATPSRAFFCKESFSQESLHTQCVIGRVFRSQEQRNLRELSAGEDDLLIKE